MKFRHLRFPVPQRSIFRYHKNMGTFSVFKPLKNRRGMNLVGLMVAVGLGSVVSLAVVNLMKVSAENQKSVSFKSELLSLKNRFSEVLHQDQTFRLTIDAAANTNMACLRNRTDCPSARVATSYNPSQDRLVLYASALPPANSRVFYDGRAGSTNGYTLKGAECSGFVATGSGNDNCPVGFIVSWFVNRTSSTNGLAVTIVAKMVFNPSDSHPLKQFYNSTSSTTMMSAYDIAVTKTIRSLTDMNVTSCTVPGSPPIVVNNMGAREFFQTSSVTAGNRCTSEVRVCSVVNGVASLSGSFVNPNCVQPCHGSWTACTAACGGGTRVYQVEIPSAGGGTSCPATTIENCNMGPCSVNCVGAWGPCNAGSRTFTVITPRSGGGDDCEAANGATQSCGAVNCAGSWSACSGGTQSFNVTTPAAYGGAACPASPRPCGINCAGDWSACSNGSRSYTISIPASGGGMNCPFANGQTQACGVNCAGSWSACSGGAQAYSITTPASGGGAACPFTNGQTRTCGVDCDGYWSACSSGSQTYNISTPASGGGAACPATSGQTRSCGTDCVGSWGTCSNGSQTYNVSTPASGGGAACSHVSGATQSCGVNCVGSWSSCDYFGTQTYSITTPASGGGAACSHASGATQSCGPGFCNEMTACNGMAHRGIEDGESCSMGMAYMGQCPFPSHYQAGPINCSGRPGMEMCYWKCYRCGPGSTASPPTCYNNPACSH